MTMGLEPKWTDFSDMLSTCTDDQLLKWKEVAENPRGDNFGFITTLRQLVVHMYNKRAKDIINDLSIAVNNEINSRKEGINMDKKLEARIARLEKLLNEKLLERRIAKLESVISDERYVGDLDDSTADYIYREVKDRLSRKYTSVKLLDGCTDTYTEWVIAMSRPGEYVSYSLTPGKDEDYEPIDGIDVKVRGDDESEEWSLPGKKHFDNADEVISFISRG